MRFYVEKPILARCWGGLLCLEGKVPSGPTFAEAWKEWTIFLKVVSWFLSTPLSPESVFHYWQFSPEADAWATRKPPDLEAWQGDESKRFFSANHDLQLDSRSVRILLQDDRWGWIHLLVEVHDTTTLEDLKKTWPLICDYRDRLREWQGQLAVCGGYEELIYQELSAKHKASLISYAEIADRFNRKIEECLVNAHARGESNSGRGWTFGACYLMRLAGVSPDDAEAWASDGLSNITHGETAFPPNCPVTRELVKEKMRYWRKKQATRRGVEKAD